MNKTSYKYTLKIGTVLSDKWIILEFIAKGGMGEVYRAHQSNLNRDVAIKIISKDWLNYVADDEEELKIALQRFQREVQIMAGINHPNVLQIYDYNFDSLAGEEGDMPIEYIVMEYISGNNTLRTTMSEYGFAPEEDLTRDWIKNYFFPVLDGVEAMHNLDIVHRDLKPENIMLTGNIPKIADFGLSRSGKMQAVTISADFKGTLVYMPTEQFSDFRRTDARADIYALGKILYESIEGKIGSSSSKSVNFKSVSIEKPETRFFEMLSQSILKATAEERDERFATIKEFRDSILKAMQVPENAEKSKAETEEAKSLKSGIFGKKWIITGGIASAVIFIFSIWHLLSMQDSKVIIPKNNNAGIEKKSVVNDESRADISHQTITSENGDVFHYLHGGTLNIRNKSGKIINVPSFYLGELPITNQQYINFLNKVHDKIKVKENVVFGNNEIWLLLGEVMEGYEPIVYKNGEFRISHPGHAACPVLRVTGYGASAYAHFYGSRLPAVEEWLYAYQNGKKGEKFEIKADLHDKKTPTPVILLKADIFGIRGLGDEISEWVVAPKKPSSAGEQLFNYMEIGYSVGSLKQNGKYPAVKRQPWEAFEEVGFRCVIDTSKKE